MAGPEGVGSGSAVAPVGAGSGSAVAPVDTTGSDKPKPASPGKGSAASQGGPLPPVASNQVETGPLNFEAIDAALIRVNAAVDAREEVAGPYREALEKKYGEAEVSDSMDGIIEVRKTKYEKAYREAKQALEILGQEIEREIVGDSYNGPFFVHPRTAQEWQRAEGIAATYLAKKGGIYVCGMARQLGRVVDGVKTVSNFKKWGTAGDAADYVTRPRPGENAAERWINQFRRFACLLNDVTRNTNVDKHIFAQLVIGCAEAMGVSTKKDLDVLEGIVARYGENQEITDWIKEARRLAFP
jgi:hypothetical protein